MSNHQSAMISKMSGISMMRHNSHTKSAPEKLRNPPEPVAAVVGVTVGVALAGPAASAVMRAMAVNV
jgi:hypothetical protein